MDESLMAKCFNEWMRRFIEDPDGFEHEFQTVSAYQSDKASGKEPSYGETSAAYIQKIASELTA